MNQHSNPIEVLGHRAQAGDLTARAQLDQHLQLQMIHIVERTLRVKREKTSMDRKISSIARSVEMESDDASLQDTELFMQQVAQRVCQKVMAAIRPATEACFLTPETASHLVHLLPYGKI